jgi:hypothetical protein
MQHIHVIFGRGSCTPADLTLRVFCVLADLGVSIHATIRDFTDALRGNHITTKAYVCQKLFGWVRNLITIQTCVGYEVFTPVVMKITISWDIMLCSPMKVNRRFGGTYRLHLESRKISRARYQSESRWKAAMLWFWLVSFLSCSAIYTVTKHSFHKMSKMKNCFTWEQIRNLYLSIKTGTPFNGKIGRWHMLWICFPHCSSSANWILNILIQGRIDIIVL